MVELCLTMWDIDIEVSANFLLDVNKEFARGKAMTLYGIATQDAATETSIDNLVT